MENTGSSIGKGRLSPFLSPVGAWSYGVGTAIGWGSLVVTSSQYLLQAGPLGSVLGILAGAFIMLFVARCYAYMMNRYPDSGGSYTYVRHVLGNDYGFLLAWFLVLTYLSVFWANATSLPLFSRFFLGGFFKVGYLYTLFGYDVYLGEVLLTMAAIALVGLLCTRSKRIKERIMIVLVFLFTAGITICFFAAIFMHRETGLSFNPKILPDKSLITQIVSVGLMTPWAYIGFESIAHSTEEFNFSPKKSFKILFAVVITTTLLYIFVTILSTTAYPSRYESWFAYMSDLDNLGGIEGIPPFYAAGYYLGDTGIYILMGSLLALVGTSLIGNLVALSRLFVTLARDGLVSEKLSELNSKGTPQRSVLLIAGASLLIPFLGRTPIGWIVDITTIGAVVVYGLVSLSELHIGRIEDDKYKVVMGGVGFAVMGILGLMTVLPSLFSNGSLAGETYFLVTVWAILGFLYFRATLHKDKNNEYGSSIIVWVFLLSLVLFTSTAWMQKANQRDANAVNQVITEHLEENAASLDDERILDSEISFIGDQFDGLNKSNTSSSFTMFLMAGIALAMMISNYRFMQERQELTNRALNAAHEKAYRDSLTGVKNKAAFLEWENEIDTHVEEGDDTWFAVIVCDVNGLKFVNDTLGHAAGDAYICEACKIVCRHFAHSPVFRIGGDEFVVVPQGSDLENMRSILAEFNKEVEGNIGANKAVVSAGYSIFRPGHDRQFHDVFERADARMYQRKMQLKSMGAATRE